MSSDPSDRDSLLKAATTHRLQFADLIESLSADELATPSLCDGWTTREVAGHLSVTIPGAVAPFVIGIAKAFGRPHRANRIVAAEAAKRPVAELVATIRQHATSRFAPPFVGPAAPLTDVLVHTGDVARPLGREHNAEPAAVAHALNFLTGPHPIGFAPPRRLSGIALVATDLDRTWGSGATVRGRGLDQIMAVCGRAVALDGLEGDGIAVLATRI